MRITFLDNIVHFAGMSTFINYSHADAWQWALVFWLDGKICAHAAWVCSSLVETLTFVGQRLQRVLDVTYLCWRASRTSALSSRPVVACLLPELRRSFTSPGFSLWLLSILYTVLCNICIVWAMCDTVVPAAFIPLTCHRWLMVLFPMTKPNKQVTKSWLLGWQKLCWFQLYCSKTIWSISLIFARHVTRYIHIILTFFQEATQCLTLWKISLENFCKNFFPGVYNHSAKGVSHWSIGQQDTWFITWHPYWAKVYGWIKINSEEINGMDETTVKIQDIVENLFIIMLSVVLDLRAYMRLWNAPVA